MKCTECPKYNECVMSSDLRRKRRNCTYARDKRPTTNYDRIKAMSVEEMAQELVFFVPESKVVNYTGLSGKYTVTAEETIENNVKWLESEVKE